MSNIKLFTNAYNCKGISTRVKENDYILLEKCKSKITLIVLRM